MKMKALLLTLPLLVLALAPAANGEGTDDGPWQTYHEVKGGVSHAFSQAGIVRHGDRVRVRDRALEAAEKGNTRVTTTLFDLDCRQRTFRILEVVEELEGEKFVCRTPSDDYPIRPGKHPHLEILYHRLCP